MDILLYLKSIIIGIAIAAPLGPINVLCVQRTLTSGRKVGFLSGFGAATADGLYGAVAAFGITLISSFLIDNQRLFHLIGGLFLFYLGIKVIIGRTMRVKEETEKIGYFSAYVSAFFLNLISPVTILSFAAVIAGLGVASLAHGKLVNSLLIVFGIFTGSMIWAAFMSLSAHFLGSRLGDRRVQWLNIIAGTLLIVFGIMSIAG